MIRFLYGGILDTHIKQSIPIPIPMPTYDPLLEYEKQTTHITVSRAKEFYTTHPRYIRRWILR